MCFCLFVSYLISTSTRQYVTVVSLPTLHPILLWSSIYSVQLLCYSITVFSFILFFCDLCLIHTYYSNLLFKNLYYDNSHVDLGRPSLGMKNVFGQTATSVSLNTQLGELGCDWLILS